MFFKAVLTCLFLVPSAGLNCCELNSLSIVGIPNDINTGGLSIHTTTDVGISFKKKNAGIVDIIRTTTTSLIGIDAAVLGMIDSFDKTLPRNDCNVYAQVIYSGVTLEPPKIVASAKLKGSGWVCSPSYSIPCGLELRRDQMKEYLHYAGLKLPRLPSLPDPTGGLRGLPGFPGLPGQPGAPHLFPLNPRVKMCPGPRVKTKLGNGSASFSIEFFPVIASNKVQITSNDHADFNADEHVKFLLGTFAGIAKVLGVLNLKDLAPNLPSNFQIPETPKDLEWIVKDAYFFGLENSGQVTKALRVEEVYTNAKSSTACAYYNLISGPEATDASASRRIGRADLVPVLEGLAAESRQRLDWRRSVVDLLKTIKLGPSLQERSVLAQRLGRIEGVDGSARANLWLHGAIVEELLTGASRLREDGLTSSNN